MMRRESGLVLQLPHDLGDLVDVAAVGRRPGAPLHAVDRAEVAVGAGPFVPDRHAALLQPARIAVAAQEPQQLEDDGLEVDLLRRHQREALGEVEAHLVAEHARVPVPVRSALATPCVATWRMKSSYCERIGRVGVSAMGHLGGRARLSAASAPARRNRRRGRRRRSGRGFAQEDLDAAIARPAGVGARCRPPARARRGRRPRSARRPRRGRRGSRARCARARARAGC